MGVDTVNKAFSRKIDPEEPWRYVCPKCGSQVYRGSSTDWPRCEKHGIFEDGFVLDKKESEEVKLNNKS